MSLLLRYRKLGIEARLRVDAPELEPLALGLQSSAVTGRESCEETAAAELVWQRRSGEAWQIRLKGELWREAALSQEELFLQSDSLLDDLIREQLALVPMLHAGGVVHPLGGAVVICGASGAGKTSLVTECILQGWNWLSDERLCFRQQNPLQAEGFRRNFNLKERSFGNFPEIALLPSTRELIRPHTGKRVRFFDPEELGRGRFQAEGTVRAVVVPRFDASASGTVVTPLGGVELVNLLVPELRTTEIHTARWIAEFSRQVPAFGLRYSNPRGLTDVLGSLVETGGTASRP
jgi:hypothetical protein